MAESPQEFMARRFPSPNFLPDAVAFLATVGVSGSIKRRLLREWADHVGVEPTKFDFDRAARTVSSAPSGGQ